MENNSIRFLCESYTLKEQLDESTNEKKVILEGVALDLTKPTRNGVLYTLKDESQCKQMVGKPFLDTHKEESIRDYPPFGHVIDFMKEGTLLKYRVDVDPSEEVFIRKARRHDIPGVSIQVLVEDANEMANGTLRATIREFLELSAVLIPGYGDTTMSFVESFKANKIKEQYEETCKRLKEFIEQRDGKWVVIDHKTGNVLGTHDSEDEAKKQLSAIYANKKEDISTANGAALIAEVPRKKIEEDKKKEYLNDATSKKLDNIKPEDQIKTKVDEIIKIPEDAMKNIETDKIHMIKIKIDTITKRMNKLAINRKLEKINIKFKKIMEG